MFVSQYVSIGSGNGLSPNWWQAITWTNADPVHWRVHADTWWKLIDWKYRYCRLAEDTESLQWRHNGLDSVANHQPHDYLFSRLFGRRSEKTSKLRVTGLCAWNSPGTGEFPAQMASYAENVSIWWRHHELISSPGQRVSPLALAQSGISTKDIQIMREMVIILEPF